MRLTIHQPEHLPWLGFLHKSGMADTILILDTVQFRKNYFHNRNRVLTANGPAWITVPIQRAPLDTPLSETRINNSGPWAKKCWKTISLNYSKAPFYKDYAATVEAAYSRSWDMLAELNMHFIRFLFDSFGISTSITLASRLPNCDAKGGQLILDLCKMMGASTYVSGISGKDYLQPEAFHDENIALEYQEFHHPIYSQLHSPFHPLMSSLDALFNHGPKAGVLLYDPDVPRIEELFE